MGNQPAPPRAGGGGLEQSPAHGRDGGDEAEDARMTPRRPSYVPRRRVGEEQPHATPPRPAAGQGPLVPAPQEAVPGESSAMPPVLLLAGKRPPRTKTTPKKIVRNRGDDGATFQDGRSSPTPSPYFLNKMKRQTMVCCSMLCCIHFWLLVIAVSLAMVVVVLVYHPKSPRLCVTSATLDAAHIDKRNGGAAGVLNANLTVVAAISNPNTKISIVLRYVQLDLYFEDIMIAKKVVWPAPLQEAPRGSVLRRVHLVASNVIMAQEGVFTLQNATTKGRGPVVLRLAGRFHTQLDFGRWFRCRYWVNPKCTLWLDPPPRGALRRSQC